MQSSSFHEVSPLLVKSGNANTNTYSQHTFDTLATSESDESVVNSKSYQAEDVPGSIVVFETNIKEGTTEEDPEDQEEDQLGMLGSMEYAEVHDSPRETTKDNCANSVDNHNNTTKQNEQAQLNNNKQHTTRKTEQG